MSTFVPLPSSSSSPGPSFLFGPLVYRPAAGRPSFLVGALVYLPAAGTSEFQSLSADEVVELVRITREASGPDAQIFAPVGLQVGHAVEIGQRSMEAGADGIIIHASTPEEFAPVLVEYEKIRPNALFEDRTNRPV